MKEARHNKVYTELFYLYTTQKQTELTYVFKGEDRIYFGEVWTSILLIPIS